MPSSYRPRFGETLDAKSFEAKARRKLKQVSAAQNTESRPEACHNDPNADEAAERVAKTVSSLARDTGEGISPEQAEGSRSNPESAPSHANTEQCTETRVAATKGIALPDENLADVSREDCGHVGEELSSEQTTSLCSQSVGSPQSPIDGGSCAGASDLGMVDTFSSSEERLGGLRVGNDMTKDDVSMEHSGLLSPSPDTMTPEITSKGVERHPNCPSPEQSEEQAERSISASDDADNRETPQSRRSVPVSNEAIYPTVDMEEPVMWPDHWPCEGKVIAEEDDKYVVDWTRIRIPRSDADITQDANDDWVISFYPSYIPMGLASKGMRRDWKIKMASMNAKDNEHGLDKSIENPQGQARVRKSLPTGPKRRRGRPYKVRVIETI